MDLKMNSARLFFLLRLTSILEFCSCPTMQCYLLTVTMLLDLGLGLD